MGMRGGGLPACPPVSEAGGHHLPALPLPCQHRLFSFLFLFLFFLPSPSLFFFLCLFLFLPLFSVGAIFELSLSCAPEHESLLEGSFYVHLVPGFSFSGDPVFVVAPLGTPLDHLALEAKGVCILGSHRTVTFLGLN